MTSAFCAVNSRRDSTEQDIERRIEGVLIEDAAIAIGSGYRYRDIKESFN